MLNILNTRFAPLTFRSADKGGGGGGGGNQNPPANLTLEQQLSKARDDLAAAQGQVTSLTTERDSLAGQVTALTTERDQLKSQFDTLTTAANQTKQDLTAAQSQVSALTSERAGLNTQLSTASANVTRLEALCGVKGVDSKAVPPAAPNSEGSLSYAEWDKRIAAATGLAKAELLKQFESAVRAGNIAQG